MILFTRKELDCFIPFFSFNWNVQFKISLWNNIRNARWCNDIFTLVLISISTKSTNNWYIFQGRIYVYTYMRNSENVRFKWRLIEYIPFILFSFSIWCFASTIRLIHFYSSFFFLPNLLASQILLKITAIYCCELHLHILTCLTNIDSSTTKTKIIVHQVKTKAASIIKSFNLKDKAS